MDKQTFKQYLESKQQLLKAIENTPITVVEYEVKKYCSLVLGETEDEKVLVALKPKQKIVVEWEYVSVNNPTPNSIKFVGVKDVDQDETYSTFWAGTKLQKWLLRHARRGENKV